MPLYKVNAVVLRRNDLGETDRILRLLTRECGRVDAVAKGARRGTSRLSGATEIFTHSRMMLATGKTLDIVSQCEIRESFPPLRSDLPSLSRATYMCELVERFVDEREPNAEVFDLLLSGLYLLQRATEHPDVIVHAFELRLLDEAGYQPSLSSCVRCGMPISHGRAGFTPSSGGALCAEHRYELDDAIAVKPATLQLMSEMLSADVNALVAMQPDPASMLEIGKCLRWYIRYRVDRDLRSADFLEMIRASS